MLSLPVPARRPPARRRAALRFAVAFACFVAAAARAQPDALPELPRIPASSALAKSLQAIVDSHRASNQTTGLSAAVIVPGEGIWVGAAGYSDPGAGVALRPDMVSNVASITKTFVAALVLRLAEEGALSLDDAIADWLPPYPNVDASATIRQLLGMRSGIGDYINHKSGTPVYNSFSQPSHFWTLDELLRTQVPARRFSPGQMYEYSNTNYLLLARIAEVATGRGILSLLREYIFEPFQLESTYFAGYETIGSPIARADLNFDGRIDSEDVPNTALYSAASAAGGIFSNAENIARWAYALYGGEMLGEESLDAMLAIGVGSYGLGVFRYSHEGHRFVGHGGDLIGYHGNVAFSPQTGVTVALLINHERSYGASSGSLGACIREIVKRFRANPFQPRIELGDAASTLFVGETLASPRVAVSSPWLRVEHSVIDGPAAIVDGELTLLEEGAATLRARSLANDFFAEAFIDRAARIVDPARDPDGDGFPNLLEWALGRSMEDRDAESGIAFSVDSGAARLAFKPAQRDARYRVETSADLASWTEEGVALADPDAAEIVEAIVEIPGGEARFLRLRVELAREEGD